MLLETRSQYYTKTHAADSTDATFPSRIPTTTEPTGDGVIEIAKSGTNFGPSVYNSLLLLPIGTGANNAVLTGMRVIRWNCLRGNGTTTKDLWIPVVLVEFAAVFGNITGVLNAALGATYFFMDTITLVTGNANVSNEALSPTGDVIGHAVVDLKGAQKVEVTFDLGANATAANCLWTGA